MAAMEGRFHAYEGYTHRQITFPVRVMKALGADLLIVSNACGGMNPQHTKGDIMVIEDHINLMNGNPLIGVNDDTLGPRFPDMIAPYDPELIEVALEIARRENFAAHKGVYVAVTGPNLETRASIVSFVELVRTWSGCQRFPRSLWRSTRGCVSWGCRSLRTNACLMRFSPST